MEGKHNISGRRFFIGFIFVAIGLVMILERADLISWELYDFLLSWKMLLIAIGSFIFISGNRIAGLIVMAVGAFAIFPDIFSDYKDFFWPAVIILIGGAIIFKSSSKKHAKFKADHNSFEFDQEWQKTEVNNDFFDEMVIFGGREINLSTKNLMGGKSTAIFGGIEIDLRQCELSAQSPAIDVTTLFGSNTIKVPNDWTVLNRVTTIFGGFGDSRIKDPMYAPNPAKTIVITGACIFGGTEISNFSKIY